MQDNDSFVIREYSNLINDYVFLTMILVLFNDKVFHKDG